MTPQMHLYWVKTKSWGLSINENKVEMNLVAIYLKAYENQSLYKTPQTINFGGQFSYSFEERNESLIVHRKKNENYISGFYSQNSGHSHITNFSAVVGQNGAGKTSLMNIIRSHFIEHPYSRIKTKSWGLSINLSQSV